MIATASSEISAEWMLSVKLAPNRHTSCSFRHELSYPHCRACLAIRPSQAQAWMIS